MRRIYLAIFVVALLGFSVWPLLRIVADEEYVFHWRRYAESVDGTVVSIRTESTDGEPLVHANVLLASGRTVEASVAPGCSAPVGGLITVSIVFLGFGAPPFYVVTGGR